MGEAVAEVDVELGLQRSSTNPPLQTDPTESQTPTVAAGPGCTGSQKRKLRRQGFRTNEAASGATALQSPVARGVAPKRRKGSKNTPPPPPRKGMRIPKRPGCRPTVSGGVIITFFPKSPSTKYLFFN